MEREQLETLRRGTIWSIHTGPLPIGNAESAASSLVFTNLYAASLNHHTKFADWVGYRVTAASQSGRNSLNRNWLHLAKHLTLEAQDYVGSEYSMGHLCPLASVRADADAWEVNWTGIVAPQRQTLNAGPWLDLEQHTRQLARQHGLVMVMCGTLYEHDMPPLPSSDESHVVPSHFWARVFVPSTKDTTAWIMPQSADRKDSHEQYIVQTHELTERSGLLFLDRRR